MYIIIIGRQHTHHVYMCYKLYAALRRYWWVKIRALAESGDYEELEKFSKQKKSPIGYEVRVLLDLSALSVDYHKNFSPLLGSVLSTVTAERRQNT